VTFLIYGCIIEQRGDSGSNALRISDYNDAVASYNRLVMSFTRLARLVDKNINEQHESDKNFCDKFELAKQDVLVCIDETEGYWLQDNRLKHTSEKILFLINKMKEYIYAIEINKNDIKDSSRQSLKTLHGSLYNEMLKLSTDIVYGFDSVYNKMVSK
jgi:hypothetical protein